MSVSGLLEFDNAAYEAQSVRCFNLRLDGSIYDANGNYGTYLIGNIDLTAAYPNDSYTVGLNNLAYTKFGHMVNLELRSFLHTVVTGGGSFTIGTIPASIRPNSVQNYVIEMRAGGVNVVGVVQIDTAGVILLTPPGGNFTAGSGGIPTSTSVTYSVS